MLLKVNRIYGSDEEVIYRVFVQGYGWSVLLCYYCVIDLKGSV